MNNYYEEIENIIKRNEVNKYTRRIEENNDILTNYWNIGKLLVEAQGGEARAKYGNELIKKWSVKLTNKYGKGYDSTSLKRFRQFYLIFEKGATLSHQLTWSHIQELLSISDINKRNYYINICIKNYLSVRDLRELKKNNTYERLIDKPEHVEIISDAPKYSIKSGIHNPILLELSKNERIENEHDLEVILLAKLKSFFSQLGEGFLLAGNQYKISYENKDYYIDILLFNIELNCYVVVELKVRELRKEDKGQIEFYMNLIDKTLKKTLHNKTIGILITKEQDKFIANFVSSDEIIPLTYQVI